MGRRKPEGWLEELVGGLMFWASVGLAAIIIVPVLVAIILLLVLL